ncbi:alpha/beta hydrolase [Prochlorococcus marinus]|uniref:Serine peptidase n=1 Tax=Prochlorococcus marinus XMU1408 TaxID=2213228 RepID=A0A318QY01_PROMR|nr:alpha/beta hydrolase [Prochlorococcus marinus]MBW3042313.1 serine peptidase [Prochlorococcus marinus str. XMU1408]PYE01699.1 serine peptidase [Prochlorococcus marinus XMU1408]
MIPIPFIKKLVVLGLAGSLLAPFYINPKIRAAERFEIHFDGMSIPISIKELIDWSNSEEQTNSELASWLNLLGFKERKGLTKFLNTPLVRDKSMARQILRSWSGRKLLDEVSDLILMDEDSSGNSVLDTLENLLNEKDEVTTFDLLNSLSVKAIHIDLDGWIEVANNWRNELKQQQQLISDLVSMNEISSTREERDRSAFEIKETEYELISLSVSHRNEPLKLEVWNPSSREISRKNWVLLMPGLGGDGKHFNWLARSLSHNGWSVVVLAHPGSDSLALEALVKGRLPLPGADVIPDRMNDLDGVLHAKKIGKIDISSENVVLIGHSLGALTAVLASGAEIDDQLESRCQKVLDNLSLTNLSSLLQCQLVDISLPDREKIENLSAIVGMNSFGSFLWQRNLDNQINIPLFLTGGTFDLVTPSISEQLGLLLSVSSSPFSRVLLIEGASHFSPIRVEGQMNQSEGKDLFNLGESIVGYHPLSVQSLLAIEIISFLEKLEEKKAIPSKTNLTKGELKFHVLDKSIIEELIKVQ